MSNALGEENRGTETALTGASQCYHDLHLRVVYHFTQVLSSEGEVRWASPDERHGRRQHACPVSLTALECTRRCHPMASFDRREYQGR